MTEQTTPRSRITPPALASTDFDGLFDIVDLVMSFINIINSIIETLLNFGDYLNGQ